MLASRNRLLLSQYEDISFRSVVARASKLLLDLSREGAIVIDRQIHPNGQLAALIAAGPESFSRSLSLLRRKGFIQCSRDYIHIVETNALAEFVLVEIA